VRYAAGKTSSPNDAARAGHQAHAHRFSGLKIGHAEAAQRLHVNEDILGAAKHIHKAEALLLIEPFDPGGNEISLRLGTRGDLRRAIRTFGIHLRSGHHAHQFCGLEASLTANDNH
jgi:hypothetical protein